MKRILTVIISVVVAAVASGCAIDRSALATPVAMRDLPPPPEAMNFTAEPQNILEEGVDYGVVIETNRGNITLDLFEQEAPVTVNNFVFLAEEGFYDGVAFHRVIADFMIQTGDRNGIAAGRPGTGGPGYSWADEASALALPHDGPGVLSMANAGPNTNGSQFFITHVETPWLNGAHAVFGKVVDEESQAVVDAIRQNDVMVKVTITRDGQ